MRNLLQKVPEHAQGAVAALVRTIFAQPHLEAARRQLDQVSASLQRRFPQVAQILQQAAEEVLTYMHFPQEHWRQLHSTNPLRRLNWELARRFDVVGIFPNSQAVLRLLGAVLEGSGRGPGSGPPVPRFPCSAQRALPSGKRRPPCSTCCTPPPRRCLQPLAGRAAPVDLRTPVG